MAILAGRLDAVAKRDQVERDVVLLEFLGETDQGALGVRGGIFERGADENNHSLAEVLILPVLERELRDCDCGRDGGGVPEVRGRVVHGSKYLTDLLGVCDEHLWTDYR